MIMGNYFECMCGWSGEKHNNNICPKCGSKMIKATKRAIKWIGSNKKSIIIHTKEESYVFEIDLHSPRSINSFIDSIYMEFGGMYFAHRYDMNKFFLKESLEKRKLAEEIIESIFRDNNFTENQIITIMEDL